MASSITPPQGPDPIGDRRRREFDSLRRQSRRVRLWRRVLPILFLAIAGLLVLWIGGRSLIIKPPSASAPKNAGVRMVNPRFYGRDSSNRAFVLGAAEASRDLGDEHKVILAGPSVTLGADEANPTHVDAVRGVYHEDRRKLSLEGKVQVTNGQGFSFTTPTAMVDTANGQVSGESGVQGDGPLGRIVASSYGVYDRGQRIVLRGDVHAHIVQ